MAAPPWGGDFGAALAGAPGFALLAWLLLGRRVRARTVVLLGTILVASGLLVGIVDMLRPSSQQTHVGRFFDRVTEDGFGGFFLVIRRKAMENFGSFTTTRLVWLIPIGRGVPRLPVVDPIGTRPRARAHDARHRAHAGRVRAHGGPRLRAQRFGDRDSGADGARARVRRGVPGGGPARRMRTRPTRAVGRRGAHPTTSLGARHPHPTSCAASRALGSR